MEARISWNKQLNSFVIKATTKCEHGFSCLSDSNECLCEVKCAGPEHFVEIKAHSSDSCRYFLAYNNFTYCLCPTRNEIYKRYNI